MNIKQIAKAAIGIGAGAAAEYVVEKMVKSATEGADTTAKKALAYVGGALVVGAVCKVVGDYVDDLFDTADAIVTEAKVLKEAEPESPEEAQEIIINSLNNITNRDKTLYEALQDQGYKGSITEMYEDIALAMRVTAWLNDNALDEDFRQKGDE